MASMMNGLAEQYTELAPNSRARNPTRMASSGDARPCGVEPERKLCGAAATSRTGGISNTTGWLLGALLFLTNLFILPAVNGQSIGKMLTGLRIIKMDGRGISFGTVLLRNFIGYTITGLTLGLGFLIALLGKNGRALHDLIGGTVVVYARKRVR